MNKSDARPPQAVEGVEQRVVMIRGQHVLLDSALASLYGVSPKMLLQAVRRNRARFPRDFMFQLTSQEVTNLRSQIVTSSLADRHGGRRYLPYAFTEQGIAMLSSVLRSPTAIKVNIDIMRTFVRLRRAAVISHELVEAVSALSLKVENHDIAIRELVESIAGLVNGPGTRTQRRIGFTADIDR